MFTSPTNPNLYRVEITLNGETITDEIGFRTIETRGKQILLNGNPTFLKGICLHEEKPNGGGRANSAEDARTLLTWAKKLGCNFVRLAHYARSQDYYNMKGLVSDSGQRKKAWYVLKEWYEGK